MFFRGYRLSLVLFICGINIIDGANFNDNATRTVSHRSLVSEITASTRSLKERQHLTDQLKKHFSLLDQLQALIDQYRTKISDYGAAKCQPLATTRETTHNSKTETTQSTDVSSEPWTYEGTEKQMTSTSDLDTMVNDDRELSTISTPKGANDVTIRCGSFYGSTGGGPFDDGTDLNVSPIKPCVGVEVFWKSHLFAIRFMYEQDTDSIPKKYHGHHQYTDSSNASLGNEIFLLSNEERISKITLYVGTGEGTKNPVWTYGSTIVRYVMGIQFYTTTGRISTVYGSTEGEEFTESYGGFTLGYAKGRSGLLVDALQFVWYNQGSFGQIHDEVWMEAENGQIPPDAVVGGLEDNRRVYVVRFPIKEGRMIPGKLVEGSTKAECEYFGVRTSSNYQVLINPESKKKLQWVPIQHNKLPQGSFLAGKEGGVDLYVSRVVQSSSLIYLGKYHPYHAKLYFTYEKEGRSIGKNVEILCIL